jgi:inhibitor of cysteine peptidase
MMKKISIICVRLLLLACALSGCSSRSRQISPDDNGSTITLRPGQALVVTLESNPTTGYSWQPVFDSKYLEQRGETEFEPESSLIGAGGTETFRFEAIQPGTTTLTLNYMRPWEKDMAPEGVFKLIIMVE